MEYTNEFLARVYGAYMGCECIYGIEQEKGFVMGVDTRKERVLIKSQENENSDWWDIKEYEAYPISLISLSEISDEDAIEVARMLDPWLVESMEHEINRDKYRLKISGKYNALRSMQIMWVDGSVFCSDYQNLNNRATDLLRSRGYDTGFAEIPSLIDAGIAIKTQQP